jgi:biotin carboxyl carrier protein
MWNPNRPSQEDRRRRGWADEEPHNNEDACANLASEFAQFADECGVAIWSMKDLGESSPGSAHSADVDKPEHVISCDVLNICSAIAQTGHVPGALVNLCHQILARLDPNRFDPAKLNHPIVEAALAYSLKASITGTVSIPIALQFLILHDRMHGGSRARSAARVYSLLVLQLFNFYLPCSLDDPASVAAAGGIANEFLEQLKPYLGGENETHSASDAQPGESRLGEGTYSCPECSNAYQLLELPYGAPLDEVQRARRELAKSLHPDIWVQKRGAHLAQEQLKQVNVACDHLAECRLNQPIATRDGGSAAHSDQTDDEHQLSGHAEFVVVPEIDGAVANATITRWLRNIGDDVKQGEPLFEISTDKVDVDVPSPVSGFLSQILIQAGETVPTKTTVGVITRGELAQGKMAASRRNEPQHRNLPLSSKRLSSSDEEQATGMFWMIGAILVVACLVTLAWWIYAHHLFS